MQSFEERIREQKAALCRFDARPLEEILKERAMPKPLWAQRSMTDEGAVLEEKIREAAAASPADAFCIYTHVPYCRTRCGYCDCYSFPLVPSRLPELAVYPGLLEREIGWWGEHVPVLRGKRLSTIHFGGGTPLMIGTEGLSRVLDAVGSFF